MELKDNTQQEIERLDKEVKEERLKQKLFQRNIPLVKHQVINLEKGRTEYTLKTFIKAISVLGLKIKLVKKK